VPQGNLVVQLMLKKIIFQKPLFKESVKCLKKKNKNQKPEESLLLKNCKLEESRI
jgi:hypothetical protein